MNNWKQIWEKRGADWQILNSADKEKVLEKMVKKSRFSIGILDIHDLDKKEDFVAYRKKTIANYEELYRDLPKHFYSKSFFEDFAGKHGLDIHFPEYDMPGYWNNEFIFHCFMYKA